MRWVAIPFSRGSSKPRGQTQVFHIAGGFFTSWATFLSISLVVNWQHTSLTHLNWNSNSSSIPAISSVLTIYSSLCFIVPWMHPLLLWMQKSSINSHCYGFNSSSYLSLDLFAIVFLSVTLKPKCVSEPPMQFCKNKDPQSQSQVIPIEA